MSTKEEVDREALLEVSALKTQLEQGTITEAEYQAEYGAIWERHHSNLLKINDPRTVRAFFIAHASDFSEELDRFFRGEIGESELLARAEVIFDAFEDGLVNSGCLKKKPAKSLRNKCKRDARELWRKWTDGEVTQDQFKDLCSDTAEVYFVEVMKNR